MNKDSLPVKIGNTILLTVALIYALLVAFTGIYRLFHDGWWSAGFVAIMVLYLCWWIRGKLIKLWT